MKKFLFILRKTRNGAPGRSEISWKVLKDIFMHKCTVSLLTEFINFLLCKLDVPVEWRLAIRTCIWKSKGNRHDLSMQRLITCTEVVLKLLEHVQKIRIENTMSRNNYLHNEQGGFCSGRGTFELFYILRCTIEEQISRNGKLYMAFLDLSKAFDKVIHNLLLWKYKNDLNVKSGIWLMFYNVLGNFKVSVKWGNILSDWININVGVFQGSVLSPTHFKIFINSLVGMLKNVNSGILVADVAFIMTLLFADDVLIIDSDEEKFREKMRIAADWARAHFSRWSVSKCVLISSDRNINNVVLQGDHLCKKNLKRWLDLYFLDSGLADIELIDIVKKN